MRAPAGPAPGGRQVLLRVPEARAAGAVGLPVALAGGRRVTALQHLDALGGHPVALGVVPELLARQELERRRGAGRLGLVHGGRDVAEVGVDASWCPCRCSARSRPGVPTSLILPPRAGVLGRPGAGHGAGRGARRGVASVLSSSLSRLVTSQNTSAGDDDDREGGADHGLPLAALARGLGPLGHLLLEPGPRGRALPVLYRRHGLSSCWLSASRDQDWLLDGAWRRTAVGDRVAHGQRLHDDLVLRLDLVAGLVGDGGDLADLRQRVRAGGDRADDRVLRLRPSA